MYYPIIRQCVQALKNLETWLDKAEQHAAAKDLSPPRQAAHRSRRIPTTGLSFPRAAMNTGIDTRKKRSQGRQ